MRWCPESLKIAFGCDDCMDALAAGRIVMPERYRDAKRSCSFAHFNITQDVKRAIAEHPRANIHQQAVGTEVLLQGSDHQVREKMLSNRIFLAVRQLMRLKPCDAFLDAVGDSCVVGGQVDKSLWASRRFYDNLAVQE